MRKVLFVLVALGAWGALWAQREPTGWGHDLYDRRGAAWAPKGWTVGLGVAGMKPKPAEWEELWQVLPAGGGVLDTLVHGEWLAESALQPALFVGRWWRFEQPVLWDRVALEFQGTRRRVSEEFTSLRADSAVWEGASAAWVTSLGLHGYRAVALTPDLYLEGMIGAGVDGLWGREGSPAGPDSLFGVPPEDVTWRFAVEGGLAFGVRIWPGRFVRLALTTDLLQFAPLAEERGAAMDVLRQGYRPWTLSLKWDLQQVRPPLACTMPVTDPFAPREKRGTQLFEEDMRPKKKKRKKRRRRG